MSARAIVATRWFAPGVATIVLGAIIALSRQAAPSILAYVALISLGGAAVMSAIWIGPARSKREVATLAIILHAAAMLGAAAFEDDYHRFSIDGWRTLETGTPYGTAPQDFFDDPTTPAALAPALDGVNHPEYPTIYGPTLQSVFALAFATAGSDPTGLRIAFATFNLALIALLLRENPPKAVALYAWGPFFLSEIVIHVHPDGIVAAFILAGLVLSRTRPAYAGAAFALAAGAKIVALAAWPLLLRLPPRALATAVFGLTALYLPFALQGRGVGLDSTATFAMEWFFNPMAFAALSALLGQDFARMAAAALGGGLIVWLHWRAQSAAATPLATIFGVALLIAPAVNPWYLLWVAPFAVAAPVAWPWVAAVALPLSYLTGLNLEARSLAPFEVHPVAWALELTLIASAIGFDVWRRRGARSDA